MSSSSFLERFRDKLSNVSKHGLVDTSSRSHVPKAEARSAFKQSANAVLQSPVKVLHPRRDRPSHLRTTSQPAPGDLRGFQDKSRLHPLSAHSKPPLTHQTTTSFTPYNLVDYKNAALTNYYTLGGLGPVHVGTTEWLIEQNKRKRREDYVKNQACQLLQPTYRKARRSSD